MEHKYVVTIYSLSGDEPVIRIFTNRDNAKNFLLRQYGLFYLNLDSRDRDLWDSYTEVSQYINELLSIEDFGYITEIDKEDDFSNIDWTERGWKKWDIGTMLLIKI